MATTMIHIRVDEKVKKKAAKTLAAMGMSVSDAVRILLVRVAAESALPFEVRVPNATTVKAMQAANRSEGKRYESAADLLNGSTELRAIKDKLLGRRYSAAEIPRVGGEGIYAFFLSDPTLLDGIHVDASSPIYVGKTESSLDARNHFTHRHSGFSTLRRSLGAILKKSLLLKAIPRASGHSPTNARNYRFSAEDEERLTNWMTSHLSYSFASPEKDVDRIERQLIKDLQPPLNLRGWENPHAKQLRALRAVCCEEARTVEGQ